MEFYQLTILIATLTIGLITGFFFTFSVILMPGIKKLSDKDYIKAFQSIDSILQPAAPPVSTRPVFGLVFFGAIVSLIASLVFGLPNLTNTGRLVLLVAAAVYVFGALLPTIRVHLPLNNKLQTYSTDTINEAEAEKVRQDFEGRWNKWNTIRTVSSSFSFILLIILVFTLNG